MDIVLLEPYYTGSHKAWADGYAKCSQHNVKILSLSGNFWKWRMHGGAVTLADLFMGSDVMADLILATDMLDLTTFLSMTRRKTASTPTALYFHENQLTYPWSPQDRDIQHNRDKHYGFINYVSALTADAVFFNSNYHMQSFLTELPRFLKHFPDYQELATVEKIRIKSKVLPLGLDLVRFDQHKAENRKSKIENFCSNSGSRLPLILWNHRWEFDKNPGEFFEALFILAERGLDFEVAILGECFKEKPDEFIHAREGLGDRIVQYGYVKDFAEYTSWLWQADILPVTSNQDFFGASVMEALYCGCFPLLPNRLAYPEIIPKNFHSKCFYDDFDDLLIKLAEAIQKIENVRQESFREIAEEYCWQNWAAKYDVQFQLVLGGC